MGEWFDLWFEAYRNNPWGPDRDDWRTRTQTAALGLPSAPECITWANSNEAVAKLKAMSEGGEQQSLDAALSVIEGTFGGGRSRN
jgi:hypothetical protein